MLRRAVQRANLRKGQGQGQDQGQGGNQTQTELVADR
jgi:hypothetical protein